MLQKGIFATRSSLSMNSVQFEEVMAWLNIDEEEDDDDDESVCVCDCWPNGAQQCLQ